MGPASLKSNHSNFKLNSTVRRLTRGHWGWSAGGQAPAGLYGPVAKEKNQCECPLTSRPRAGSCHDSSFCYKAYFDCYITFEHDISQLPRCQMERASIVKVLRRGQLEAYVRPGRFSRLGVGCPSHHIVHTGLFRRSVGSCQFIASFALVTGKLER